MPLGLHLKVWLERREHEMFYDKYRRNTGRPDATLVTPCPQIRGLVPSKKPHSNNTVNCANNFK
eukprot:255919-Pelagomonas_calceolata.AAC.1